MTNLFETPPNPERDPSDVTGSGMRLSEQQAKVAETLRSKSSGNCHFDRWYLGSLAILDSDHPDKLAQAAHSIREINDRLPRQLGVPFFKSPVSPTNDAVKELVKIKDQEYSSGWQGQKITTKLVNLLEKLVNLRTFFNAPPRTAGLRFALEKGDPFKKHLSGELRKARDQEFSECYQFFQDVAHHNKAPTSEEFVRWLFKYEQLILAYLSPTSADRHQEILEIIQTKPTEDSRHRLKELVVHDASAYALLMNRLDNEAWLPFLRELNIFNEIPEQEPLDGGGFVYRKHFPLICLARLAPKAPKLAVEVLESLPKTENPQVLDQVICCLSRIPDKQFIPRCCKVAKRVLKSPGYSGYLWFREMVISWVNLGCHKEALDVIRLIASRIVTSGRRPSGTNLSYWELKEIDEHCLPELTEQNPEKTAQVIFYALKDWAYHQRENYEMSPSLEKVLEDSEPDPAIVPSTYWLEDFERGPRFGADLEGVLAMRLYAIGIAFYESGCQVRIRFLDDLLRQDPWKLFENLRWCLYARFPDRSLDFARRDVHALIPNLGRTASSINAAAFRMLESLSLAHGNNFLSDKEVVRIYNSVMEGPLDEEGRLIDSEDFRNRFRKKQIQPIRSLLNPEQRNAFKKILPDRPAPKASDYCLLSGVGGARIIEHVPPAEASSFHECSVTEIISFINSWEDSGRCHDSEKWWIEEDLNGLARAFVDHLEVEPAKFEPTEEWWKHIVRPIFLSRVLSRAVERVAPQDKKTEGRNPPSANEWRNWFGIVGWVAGVEPPGDEDTECTNWYWARMEAVRFMNAHFDSPFSSPQGYDEEIAPLLLKLFEADDPRLKDHSKPWLHDWQTNAINSVRGTALEALLRVVCRQKRNQGGETINHEIRRAILERLASESDSPAIHALVGSRLRLFLYLFGDEVRNHPEIVLSRDRSRRNALILSNARYDRPTAQILDSLPDFPKATLDCLRDILEARNDDKDDDLEENREDTRDFGGRLGVNLAFYHWNDAYVDESMEQALLDEFFSIATIGQRSGMILMIGTMFRDLAPEEKHKKMISRTQEIWDRRFNNLKTDLETDRVSPADYRKEVLCFLDWIRCEAFDFDWRVNSILMALDLADGPLDADGLLRDLGKIAETDDRLKPALRVLDAVVSKETRTDHWIYSGNELKSLISRGLSSRDTNTVQLAESIRDKFLRLGHFDLLDHDSE